MTNYELMQAAAALDNHRQTLMVEIRDVHTLIGNALRRFGQIAELAAKDQAVAAMWGESLNGRDADNAITAEDVGALVKAAGTLQATIEAINAKRPIFWAVAESVPREDVPDAGS